MWNPECGTLKGPLCIQDIYFCHTRQYNLSNQDTSDTWSRTCLHLGVPLCLPRQCPTIHLHGHRGSVPLSTYMDIEAVSHYPLTWTSRQCPTIHLHGHRGSVPLSTYMDIVADTTVLNATIIGPKPICP